MSSNTRYYTAIIGEKKEGNKEEEEEAEEKELDKEERKDFRVHVSIWLKATCSVTRQLLYRPHGHNIDDMTTPLLRCLPIYIHAPNWHCDSLLDTSN